MSSKSDSSPKVVFDPVIDGYLAYLGDVSRKAAGTVRDVRCTLRKIIGQMQESHPDVALWKLKLEDYIQWINQRRVAGQSGASLCKYLSHVRGLLEYAWRSGRSDRNVLDGFSLQDELRRVPPGALTEDEARRLIEACPATTVPQRRDRIIVLLLYGCGLRTDELCRLNLEDVSQERQELIVWKGKGDRQRVVPIPAGVFTELLAYLGQRGGKRGALIRTAAKSKRTSAKDVCEAVRKAAERAHMATRVTPKTLRHSYATHLMDRGVDLAIISSLMGHRSPAETGVYLHVLGDKPRVAVDRLSSAVQPVQGKGGEP
ncbi:tyrosine-type recombinase/integrase [Humisphaera borealis]|uniref:Tyrosine-type recombinase/integrase n=1 Tax=Humisphaera borealis TaxID=2807512 RepID=A0A7M2X318_9BACT|nr:tyrosine-type recombinase/integrase [Humisphaera borealis]QOV92113.1 tyrosine-type recombinase/integrase [Humisphaera borealis]